MHAGGFRRQKRGKPAVPGNTDFRESKRDDCTIVLTNIFPKATEAEVAEFVSAKFPGLVKVHLVKNSETNVSKGIGYVEFRSTFDALKALALDGTNFRGFTLSARASHAEKNRSAKISRNFHEQQEARRGHAVEISGFAGCMRHIDSDSLHRLCSEFGEVRNLHCSGLHDSQKLFGSVVVEFYSPAAVIEAFSILNNWRFKDCVFKVKVIGSSRREPRLTPAPSQYCLDAAAEEEPPLDSALGKKSHELRISSATLAHLVKGSAAASQVLETFAQFAVLSAAQPAGDDWVLAFAEHVQAASALRFVQQQFNSGCAPELARASGAGATLTCAYCGAGANDTAEQTCLPDKQIIAPPA